MQAAILQPQEHIQEEGFLEEERQAARLVSPLFARVHPSILWVVAKIFAASRDGRVKKGGCVFLAHLLRFSSIDQLSLFPNTEVGDVARICIPNILKLCLNKHKNGWPWCYDTTLKYLHLLVAAGVLVTRPDERGIYYLPLGTYALLPEHAATQIEKLAGQRSRLSKSAAFKRTAVHCTLTGTVPTLEDAWQADSPQPGALVVDEQEMQRLVQALCTTLHRCQGVALLPTTLVEVTRVLATHTPHVLKKSDGRVIMKAKEDAPQLLPASRTTDGKQGREEVVDSSVRESTTSHSAGRRPGTGGREEQRRGLGCRRELMAESTNRAPNLPTDEEMVDSARVSVSEFSNIAQINTFTSEKRFSERTQASARHPGQESPIPAHNRQEVDSLSAVGATSDLPTHPQADALSLDTLLAWRFPQAAQECGMSVQSQLARLLSERLNGDEQKVGHYMKLLGQDPRALDIAIVDSLVRSYFPDPRHRQDRLSGGWITRQYKAYRAGQQVDSEILAWANTTYSYDAMETILAEVARWQAAQGRPRPRPRPGEVIVDSSALEDFWTNGAAEGLRGHGYLYVDLDGDPVPCEEYEQWRLASLEEMIATNPHVASPSVEAEVTTYLSWIVPFMCDAQEEARLLADLPDMLRRNLSHLEQVLDPKLCLVQVQITPLSHRRVIGVYMRGDPSHVRLLRSGCDIQVFVRWYRRTYQAGEGAEESPGWRTSIESTSFCRSEVNPD